jgi:hypothetical protein
MGAQKFTDSKKKSEKGKRLIDLSENYMLSAVHIVNE